MMSIASTLILVLYFLPRIISAAIDICYLIDETEDKRTIQHSIGDKLQLARNISRCLQSKGGDMKIATVVYDNNSAKLGFNFKRIDDILSDGFQQILNQRQRRNTQEAEQNQKKLLKRTTIRVFSNVKAEESSDSPQTMAFLTAAEAVVAAESQTSNGRAPNFKVLVISDSDVFPVMGDVKNYFLNASVEINALDLSQTGSTELQKIVTSPSTQHYFHTPVINDSQQALVDDVCTTLLKAPLQNDVKPFFKVNKLLTKPLNEMASSYPNPQYQYQAVTTEENEYADLNKNLDGYIEGDSTEYKWSPHPEEESHETVGDVQDTPAELYGAEDKRDICRYLHDECNTHMQAGLCEDETPQAQGMRKFCKTTCGFCV